MKFIKIDKSIKLENSNKTITYDIESMKQENNIYTISGWAIVKGLDTVDVAPTIILADEENNYYKIKTKIIKRKDVTEKIKDNKQYDNSGIFSQFYTDGLNAGEVYKVGIQTKIGENTYFIWTDRQLTLK